jgi:methionyl aminopeptidase
MSIEGPDQLAGLGAAGAVVRPGVTTAELDAVGEAGMRRHGARSAPALVYKFPGGSCISVNDEAVHGVPGPRRLQEGDLVKLDVTVEKDGFMADAAITVPVGAVSEEDKLLLSCAERALYDALPLARAGRRVLEIGRAVEHRVRKSGFSVIRDLGGHGIGRTIHESPLVPNYPDPRADSVLTDGLVIAIEPIITSGKGNVFLATDGWTVKTADSKKSAHFEHTLVVTEGQPILLTAA